MYSRYVSYSPLGVFVPALLYTAPYKTYLYLTGGVRDDTLPVTSTAMSVTEPGRHFYSAAKSTPVTMASN